MDQAPTIESSKLTPIEQALYKKCNEINKTNLTEDDFLDLRSFALSNKSPKVREFFALKDVIMQEIPDGDEIQELIKE